MSPDSTKACDDLETDGGLIRSRAANSPVVIGPSRSNVVRIDR